MSTTVLLRGRRRCRESIAAGLEAHRIGLWRTQPTAVKLRPAYPGAAIADACFLADGRIALILLLPTSGVWGQAALREAWLLDPASGRLDAFAPSIRAAALALSPDGTQLAYLQQAPPPGQAGAGTPSPSITGRLDEVWLATQNDRQPLRRVFQLPPPERGSGYGMPPVEQLADLAWSPDGRRLLLATRIGDGATPSRARLLVLDTTDAGAAPRELITMPAEPVPGSYAWSADGNWVAFVARATGAPAGRVWSRWSRPTWPTTARPASATWPTWAAPTAPAHRRCRSRRSPGSRRRPRTDPVPGCCTPRRRPAPARVGRWTWAACSASTARPRRPAASSS